MADKFRVDTDALEKVAERVKTLMEDVSGKHGPSKGTKADFDSVTSQSISEALGANTEHPMDGDGDGGSAFAKTFDQERTGLEYTYKSMIDQLTNLYNACHSTADAYKNREDGAKHNVTAPGTAF